MRLPRYVGTASVACTLAFGFAGSAFAAEPFDSVTFSQTGAGSSQTFESNNSNTVSTHNDNDVSAVSVNVQNAETGNVNADKNTTVGGLSSGDATNVNSTTTAVEVSNEAVTTVPVGGNGQGVPVGGSGAVTPGSVLGATAPVGGFGAGVETLPSVGASVPMDVSALRAAWHPQTNASAAVLAQKSQMFTGLMLLTATLLSILGAIGSALYAKRQERV